MNEWTQIEAISFDFFDTLAFHRTGSGRGKALRGYLAAHRLDHAEWEHQVLYDVFEDLNDAYSSSAPLAERRAYYVHLARAVLRRLKVEMPESNVADHAEPLWEILGPSCLDVFADVRPTLETLKAAGYPLVIISNWHPGLRHFVAELGLSPYFDHILGSADLGVAKPDPGIFSEASARLSVPVSRVLHVGDTPSDDYAGGEAAGFLTLLLARSGRAAPNRLRSIVRLDKLPGLLGRVGSTDHHRAC